MKQEVKSFEMNFMKELSLKDNVVIHESEDDDHTTATFSITKGDKTCFALELHWK